MEQQAFIAWQSNKDSFLSLLCHQDTECTSIVPRFGDNQTFVSSSGGSSGSSSALGVGSSSALGGWVLMAAAYVH